MLLGAGFNNRFVNNVASSCRNPVQQIVSGPGWKFIVPAAPYTARNPRFRGADMADAAQTIAVTPQHQPILEFRGNEVYGLAADGLTAWQLGTDGYSIMPPGMGESLIKDFRVWHTYEGAIWNYPSHRMTVDGLVYRIDPAATLYWPSAFHAATTATSTSRYAAEASTPGASSAAARSARRRSASRTWMRSRGTQPSRSKRPRPLAPAPTGLRQA